MGGRRLGRDRQVVADGDQGRPARRRDLQGAGVVDRRDLRVEVRVAPDLGQDPRADGVLVGAGRQVDRVADRRRVALGVVLAPAGERHVVDLLAIAPVVEPDLDHLHAVEVGAVGILGGLQDEARRLGAGGLGRQVGSHRHAGGVGPGDPVRPAGHRRREAPAAEHPKPHPRARGGEGLLALQGREDRVAGVLLGPDAGDRRAAELQRVVLPLAAGPLRRLIRPAQAERRLRRCAARQHGLRIEPADPPSIAVLVRDGEAVVDV